MIKGFLSGISSYSKALSLISELKLWKYVFIPSILSLFLGGLIFFSAWGLSDNIGNYLANLYPWEFGSGVVESIADVFGGLLILALGLILFKHLILIVSAPFMSPLSEAVESHLRGENVSPRFNLVKMGRDVWRGLRLAIRNVFRELFYTIMFLILGLIPIFSPFTIVGIFLIQAFYFGFGNMDFTLERHFGVKDSIRFVRQNRGLAAGNGTVTMLLMMTVVGFIFILPLGTVAATIETVKRV
ncbi:MAG: EI24 domain-containing protein [Bacteroidetes bacterium]|jgi:CysZ protein|nr:EI24 domain-containing protein [Bacteroidota bacterium]MDF1865788.1 EI24 domain-containing protein [Saprospiraceae bacterium]